MEAIIGTIGVVTLSSLVNSISTVSSSVVTLVGYIKINSANKKYDISEILASTDIEATIKLLHTIIMEIPEHCTKKLTVLMALQNVQQIIESIERELTEIHEKIVYNNSLYLFSSWRSHDYTKNIESIQSKVAILEKRKENLFRSLQVFNLLEYSTYSNNINNNINSLSRLELIKTPCIEEIF